MSTFSSPRKIWTFRTVLFGLTLIDIILVVLGLVIFPKVIKDGGLIGAGAAALMVASYGFLALYSPLRCDTVDVRLWKPAAAIGVVGGLCLGADLLSNYFIYRNGPTNSKISLVVYGTYLLLLMVSALRAARTTSRIRDGVIAAIWYVILAQLIWVLVELAAYYLFGETQVGQEFIRTEMGEDFKRSGMADFQAFVIGDLFGAVFFHMLLIGLVAGLLFGAFAGAIGKGLTTFGRGAP